MATVNLIVKKVLETNLPSTGTDGEIYLTDKQNCYVVNKSGALIKNTDIIVVDNLPIENIIPKKVYVLTTDYSLHIYDSTSWHNLSGNSISSLLIKQDGTNVESNVSEINFSGDGVSVSKTATGKIEVNVTGGASGGLFNIKNLGMTINIGATQATISFNNPASANIDKIYLFCSYAEDLSNKDYTYCSSNSTLLKDNFITTTGVSNSYNLIIDNTNRNKNIYIRVFVGYGGTDYSSGSSLSSLLKDIIPPAIATNIQATQTASDACKITWTNPTDTDLANINIRMKLDSTPISSFDGDSVFSGLNNTCTISGLEKNKHYYFRLFPQDTSRNVQDNVAQVCDVLIDDTPPDDATNFSVYSGFSICKLKYTESDSTDWKMTKIVRKIGSEPSSTDDGTVILTNLTKDAYKNNYYIDGGLNNGTVYYYKIYSIDNFGNISSGITQTGNPVATSLPEADNFKITNINDGVSQNITWTNPYAPTGLTYSSRQLFVTTDQTVALDTMTRDECIANNLITSLNSSTGTGTGVADTYANNNLTIGTIYRYKLFIEYDSSGTKIWSSGTYDTLECKDETPPSAVTGLTATKGDTIVDLTWTNPSDHGWIKTKILRKQGSYPTSHLDINATTVYDGIGSNYNDTGLTNGINYFYKAFPYDSNNNFNENSVGINATPNPLPIYGVQINGDGTLTKLNLSIGLNSSDFTSIFPFSQIKRCVLKPDKTVNYYLLSTDSSKKSDGTNADLTGIDGNFCIEIPKFYYKTNKTEDGKLQYFIAQTQLDGFSIYPAFLRNGSTVDKIYIGCFESWIDSNNKMWSIPNKTPTYNSSIPTFRTSASNIGTSWYTCDFLSLSAISLLQLIQYASFDSQTNIGLGIVNDTNIHQTGETLSLGNNNGTTGDNDGKHAVSCYGIENIWGNAGYEFTDGIVASTTKYYVSNNNFSSYVDETNLGSYSSPDSNIVPCQTSGFGGNSMEYSNTFNFALLPKTTDGSDTSGMFDLFWNDKGNKNLLFVGGLNNSSTEAGLYNDMFIDNDVLTTSNNMTNTTSSNTNITTGEEWTYEIDKSVIQNNPKTLDTFSVADDTIPAIVYNWLFNNICARLMTY